MTPSSTPSPTSGRRLRWAVVVAAVLLLAAAAWFLPIGTWLEAFVRRVAGAGVAGWLAFIGVYATVTVLALPGSVLTLGAGFAFGIGTGFALVSVASTLGAALAFLIARRVGRDAILRRFAGGGTFAAIDGAVAREGWRVVVLLRLSPLIPFNALNYLLGLTGIPFGQAVLASWVGMMPGTLLYVYLGALGRAGVEQAGSGFDAGRTALLAVGLAATVAVSVLVARRARSALQAHRLSQPPAP
jgi:uncharacterized membrane protein YdjX (TVP38/TMEM64 family)